MSLTVSPHGLRRGALVVLAVLVVALAAGLVIARTTGGSATPKAVAQQHVVGLPAASALSDTLHALPPAAATAARGFLSGYFAYLDGQIASGEIPGASRQVIAALGPKWVSPSPATHSVRPVVVQLGAQEANGSVLHVTALVSDGVSRYPVQIVMDDEHGGWLTTQLLRAE
jgi:hypothetical protein